MQLIATSFDDLCAQRVYWQTRKACTIGRHKGSLCTQKQPDWVACSAVDDASWLCCAQLESQREQEAEKAAKKHEEVAKAHSRLKRLDKDLKQLMTNQVCCHPPNWENGKLLSCCTGCRPTVVPLNCTWDSPSGQEVMHGQLCSHCACAQQHCKRPNFQV